jgi:S-DNA-T family DNA segregation ATPase FtsK/SpoIIIE
VNASELLGAVGAASLRERLTNASEGDGLARFMLDRLTGQQVAAVVQALLLDTETAKKVKIAVPRAPSVTPDVTLSTTPELSVTSEVVCGGS